MFMTFEETLGNTGRFYDSMINFFVNAPILIQILFGIVGFIIFFYIMNLRGVGEW